MSNQRRALLLPAAAAAFTLLMAGCGSTTTGNNYGPVNCAPIQPCGGNLVGDWALRGQCVKDSTTCGGAAYDYSMAGTTLHFDDGFMTVTGGGSAHDSIPHGCLTADADGGVCGEVKDQPGWSCQAGAVSCECDVDLTRNTPTAKPVKYLISGTQFLVGPSTWSYCIFQNVLRVALDTPGKGEGPVTEYVRK